MQEAVKLIWLRRKLWQIAFASSMVLAGACAPQIDARGHVDPADAAKQIHQGSSKEEVMQALGSPSSTSDFGEETWYYISGKQEREAFFAPKIIDQHVTRIVFAADGTVARMENFKQSDGKKIEIVEKETPTEGHKLGVIEQILGNVGRFNKKKSAAEDITKAPRRY
jgi:outer membrane protein assembly factor BamE (lipoprotein component of BamABCDE complex)